MRNLLKNDLIQSWIVFAVVLMILFIVAMFITPRKSVYLHDNRLSEENAVQKTVCRCIGFKEALNETSEEQPFYEERCLGLVTLCETIEVPVNSPNNN